MLNNRQFSTIDTIFIELQQSITILFNENRTASRPCPIPPSTPHLDTPNKITPTLTMPERQQSGKLMRINQTGEVCAQALYRGQAMVAQSKALKKFLLDSASEEVDHLVWCNKRIHDLRSRHSYLNPFWYASSLLLGLITGLGGDKISLGFIVETEHQVMRHLEKHLDALPNNDVESIAVLKQMHIDECEHAQNALRAGGVKLKRQTRGLMTFMSKIMTTTTRWL